MIGSLLPGRRPRPATPLREALPRAALPGTSQAPVDPCATEPPVNLWWAVGRRTAPGGRGCPGDTARPAPGRRPNRASDRGRVTGIRPQAGHLPPGDAGSAAHPSRSLPAPAERSNADGALRARSGTHRIVRTLASGVLGCLLVTLFAAPAQAAGYRYWSFWQQQDGSWSYATQGPTSLRPSDGDVIGFRFSVSEDSRDAATPRRHVSFDAICHGTDPKPGTKRIALAVDFGTAADAPEGERPPAARTACARVGEDASAADALAATAKPLRYNSAALLCAIDGYPRSGCGEQVSSEGESKEGQGESDGEGTDVGVREGGGDGLTTGLSITAGVGAVLALAAAAVWQTRHRRRD